jgi:hypothetical protein
VGDTGIEPVTSSVSGKRATAAPIARNRKTGIWDLPRSKRADDEIRTRDIHLGKVVLYQLSYVRVCSTTGQGRTASGKFPCRVGDTGIEPVTSSVSGKRATAAPIAHCHPGLTGNHGFHRGGYGIRTRVYGFAGRCLASRPTHRVSAGSKSRCRDSVLRADDEIRTRDIHLGKVVLYQLSYVRICWRESVPFGHFLAFQRVRTL